MAVADRPRRSALRRSSDVSSDLNTAALEVATTFKEGLDETKAKVAAVADIEMQDKLGEMGTPDETSPL